jgi:hypothetical protein
MSVTAHRRVLDLIDASEVLYAVWPNIRDDSSARLAVTHVAELLTALVEDEPPARAVELVTWLAQFRYADPGEL